MTGGDAELRSDSVIKVMQWRRSQSSMEKIWNVCTIFMEIGHKIFVRKRQPKKGYLEELEGNVCMVQKGF
jgi:hypothetical protein